MKSLILVGGIASGKTTIAKMLCAEYGYMKVVTYTTRPMRDGEVDGVDYHFVTEEEFLGLIEDNFFIEHVTYKRVDGLYYYGTPLNGFNNGNLNVAILNPMGVLNIYGKVDAHVVWIDLPKMNMLMRAMKRGDDVGEITRRYNEDIPQFQMLNEKNLWNQRLMEPLKTEAMVDKIDTGFRDSYFKALRKDR